MRNVESIVIPMTVHDPTLLCRLIENFGSIKIILSQLI